MFLRRPLAVLIALALIPALARAADAPKLVVYAFSVDGNAPPAIGASFAGALADEITQAGGVDVVRGNPGLTPAQFRDDARADGADYFLIGVVAPTGSSYSVLEELVKTRTGLLAWSNTVQVAGTPDLSGEGRAIRAALLAQVAATSFPGLNLAPTPGPATPTPPAIAPGPPTTEREPGAPPGADAAASLAAAEAATAPPTASPPPSAYQVLALGGLSLTGDRSFAARALVENLQRRGISSGRATAATPADLAGDGAKLCAETHAASLVGGLLDVTSTGGTRSAPTTTATLSIEVYDCSLQALSPKPIRDVVTAAISTDAIRKAADDALTAFFGATPAAPPL